MTTKHGVVRREEEDWVEFMLSHSSPAVVKRGLQFLCAEVLMGRVFYNRARLIQLLQPLRYSADARLRGWIYNSIGVLKAAEFNDYLIFQILFGEDDEENRTWATAALFVTAPEDLVRQVIKDSRSNFEGTASELAAQLYYDGELPSPARTDLLRNLERSPMFAKWYALLFGYGRTDRRAIELAFPDRDFVAALNKHHDPQVVEYSLWALHKASKTTFSDATIASSDILRLPPNARRWGYRLLTKDRHSFIANKELLLSAVREEISPIAREGLALGLGNYYDAVAAQNIIEWYTRESDELIRMALLSHFVKFSARNPDYEELIRRHVEGEHADGVGQRLIVSAASNLPQASRLRRQLRLDESRRRGTDQLVMIYEEGHAVRDGKRSVTNVAVGGGVINVSGINLGEIEHATFGAISELKATGEVKRALESYTEKLAANADVAPEDKAVAHSAVQELAQAASQDVTNPKRGLAVRKAVACLRGLVSTLPAATQFVSDTNQLVDSIGKLF